MTRKLTTEGFIIRAKEVHGDLYDYTKTDYKHSRMKVVIGCKKHGDFLQTADNHLRGSGCPKCKRFNTGLTTDKFINKAKAIYNDVYDYGKVDYKHSKIKIIISCKEHGDFEQSPASHLSGAGCPVCAGSFKHTFETLSESISKRHENTINLVENQTINGAHHKYKFRHVCGYEWIAIASNVAHGTGCPRCTNKIEYTFETLAETINKKHSNTIELLENQIINGVNRKYKFRHICGYEWITQASSIINGSSCPRCATYGFKPDKPAVFYILEIDGNDKFTGFGISNVYKSRKSAHKRNLKEGNCLVMSEILISAHGSVIQELEKYIKQTLDCNNSDIKGFKKESVLMTPKDLLNFCKQWLTVNDKEFIISNINI